MSPRKGNAGTFGRTRATVAEMDQWGATIRDLPAVRDEKIRRSRAGVRLSTYDDEGIAEATAERMREELGL